MGRGIGGRLCGATGTVVSTVATVIVTLLVATPAPASAAPAPATLVVGSATLVRCGVSPVAYCGRVGVPLDRADKGSPSIAVTYRWYPATASPGAGARGTVLPVEGGPGYPSIGSVRGGYDTMYGQILADRNLLAVDLRGTGGSTPLDCPGLQHFTGQLSGPVFAATAGACGAALDHRWRGISGRWVHASDLFTSAPAAADVAAVVRLLGLPPVDLYGDSYGSWFAQVFADHYPDLVRSVVLDSTYSTVSIDPWYRSSHRSIASSMNAVCQRSAACASAGSGTPWDRIGALASRLRLMPVTGVVPDANGRESTVAMGVVGLEDLVNDAAGDPLIYRSLDAAARALLDDDRAGPLLRLYAERLASDENYVDTSAASYSGELYLAVSCLDYPQLFSLASRNGERAAQLAASAAALPEATFAPFTTGEWLQQNQNTEAYTGCADWPAPNGAVPPITGSPPLLPARLPVLVLGGEFDSWTPPADAPGVVSQLGGHSRYVEFANATHVVGEGDQPCASSVIQAFVRAPQRIDNLDASCASSVPPIQVVGAFAGSLGEMVPLVPDQRGTNAPDGLRTAAAAAATAGDAVARARGIGAIPDVGLHGGTVVPSRGGSRLTLSRDQLIPGVSVSGAVDIGSVSVSATLLVVGPGVPMTSVQVRWHLDGTHGVARVSGTSGGLPVAGTCPIP